MGIGSETVTAVKMGRKAVGIELKEEYYDQAERNMRRAVEESQSQMLLDL
jgi:DNA modification methylase